MIKYVNSFLLLTLLGAIYYIYYKFRIFFRAINIVMDSAILNQFNNSEKLEKKVNSEVIETRKGRKNKTDNKTSPIINEVEENDMIEKRETSCMRFIS